MIKAFLAIKYYEDMRNKELIETIYSALKAQNIETFIFAKNVQNYGPCKMSGNEVMNLAFDTIKSSDIFIIDASELSIGIGVEAGVAYSNGIPIYLIANKNSYVSESIKGISKKVFLYNNPEEIKNFKIGYESHLS
ncbi:MAG: nucleoside 2-deoxyribosyltransferase [Clostridia bacterium]|nr:nucleoside 2-deoxyribosyltransferase [Clostridia bacterium]